MILPSFKNFLSIFQKMCYNLKTCGIHDLVIAHMQMTELMNFLNSLEYIKDEVKQRGEIL